MSSLFESSRRLPWMARGLGVFAVLSALASVALGAAAAHLPVFAQGVPASFESAQQMMQFHALAILLALMWGANRARCVAWCVSAMLFAIGIVLFSINIDLRLLLDWQVARPLVPWGGTAFMLGWLSMLWAILRA